MSLPGLSALITTMAIITALADLVETPAPGWGRAARPRLALRLTGSARVYEGRSNNGWTDLDKRG